MEVAAVINCIIEFGVKDGRDDDRKRLLTELFVELNSVPGFLFKETFDDVDRPGRRVTISYGTDSDALRGWMRNEAHARAIDLGKREIFSHYTSRSRPEMSCEITAGRGRGPTVVPANQYHHWRRRLPPQILVRRWANWIEGREPLSQANISARPERVARLGGCTARAVRARRS
ncbi:MAG: hypothetical protein WB902_15465 [Acetobacteraceae bacterium]